MKSGHPVGRSAVDAENSVHRTVTVVAVHLLSYLLRLQQQHTLMCSSFMFLIEFYRYQYKSINHILPTRIAVFGLWSAVVVRELVM